MVCFFMSRLFSNFIQTEAQISEPQQTEHKVLSQPLNEVISTLGGKCQSDTRPIL